VAKVYVAISGTQIVEWSSAGENIVTGNLKISGVYGLLGRQYEFQPGGW